MKNRLFTLTLVLLAFNYALRAEIKKEYKIENDGFEWFLVIENGKQGAQDKFGNTLIPSVYKMVRESGFTCCHNFFTVKDFQGNCGIYNRKGRCVIPTSKHFCHVFYSGNDSEFFIDYITCFKKEGDKKYIYELCNWKGETVIKPKKKYSSLRPEYKNGRFYYCAEDFYTEKVGIIDKDENVIIPFEYEGTIIEYFGKMEAEVGNEMVVICSFDKIPKSSNPFPKGDMNTLPPIVSNPEPLNSSSSSSNKSSNIKSSQSKPEGLLYKGNYTYGDAVDTETGTIMSDFHFSGEIEIYEDHLYDRIMGTYASYKNTTNSGTRTYEGNNKTYYVSSSYGISIIEMIASQWGVNRVRTVLSKGEASYYPGMNNSNGNKLNSNTTFPANNNPGLSAAQYQQNYNGYERIAEGIFRSFQINPDMNYGPRTQNMRTLRDAQNNMRRIRQEAASHGITIQQSSYETASPSY